MLRRLPFLVLELALHENLACLAVYLAGLHLPQVLLTERYGLEVLAHKT
jgi:hypothetical protein